MANDREMWWLVARKTGPAQFFRCGTGFGEAYEVAKQVLGVSVMHATVRVEEVRNPPPLIKARTVRGKLDVFIEAKL